MPLYTFKCIVCGHEFDELIKMDDREKSQPCKKCGKEANRILSGSFGIVSSLQPGRDTIFTPKEIDKVVGKKSEEKWAGYDQRWKDRYAQKQAARRAGKDIKIVEVPKDNPMQHLGDNKERKVRGEFSSALQEHRAKRQKQGIGQFDGPGAIE